MSKELLQAVSGDLLWHLCGHGLAAAGHLQAKPGLSAETVIFKKSFRKAFRIAGKLYVL